MRFSIALTLIGAAASVSASAFSLTRRQFPDCSITCLTTVDTGSCDRIDNPCLCRNEKFVADTTQCIRDACEGAQLEAALSASRELCEVVGVTLSESAPVAPSTSAPGAEPSDVDDADPTVAPSASPSGSASVGPSASLSGSASSVSSSPLPTGDSTDGDSESSAMTHGVNAVAGFAAMALAAFAL